MKKKLEYAGKVLKSVSPDSFKTLLDYLTGDIKWMVRIENYHPELIEFKNFCETYDNRLRLVSIYGNDQGDMTYAVGSYYDYSGGNTHYKVFNNYEDAFKLFKQELDRVGVNDYTLKEYKKHNLPIPSDKLNEYKEKKISSIKKDIESNLNAIKKREEGVKIIETI